MTRKTSIVFSSAVALFVTSLASAPALADEFSETAELNSVTVIAPQVVRRQMSGRTQVEIIQKSAAVSHRDLDLGRTADVARLEARIAQAADQVCRELTELVPNGQPAQQACASRAKEASMRIAQERARNAASNSVAAGY